MAKVFAFSKGGDVELSRAQVKRFNQYRTAFTKTYNRLLKKGGKSYVPANIMRRAANKLRKKYLSDFPKDS